MRFSYQARTKDGVLQTGTVEASSESRAMALLQEKGLFITSLQEIKPKPFFEREVNIFRRISRKDIVVLCQQLSLMLNSGVTLVEALRSLRLQAESQSFRQILSSLATQVEGGTYFSDALSSFPKEFSPLFINMVKSGEASGRLPDNLSYLAKHLEREYRLWERIKGVMIYPLFVVFVFFLVLILIVFLVLPSLSQAMSEMGVKLPAITRFSFATGAFLQYWWWAILLATVALTGFAIYYFRTEEGRAVFDRLILRTPMLGSLFRKFYLARFTENLSTLVASGLPINQSLEITSGVIGNRTYKKLILEINDRVRKGESVSSSVEHYQSQIPLLVAQMIRVGEKTGRLDKSLANVANFYKEEVQREINNVVSIIQPTLTLILGGLVGLLVVAVFLPIYQGISSFTF